jgi:hypothetical protein
MYISFDLENMSTCIVDVLEVKNFPKKPQGKWSFIETAAAGKTPRQGNCRVLKETETRVPEHPLFWLAVVRQNCKVLSLRDLTHLCKSCSVFRAVA